jgi:4-amino-4-deoxy-L-arabinose transferase-like glycosyltransferase
MEQPSTLDDAAPLSQSDPPTNTHTPDGDTSAPPLPALPVAAEVGLLALVGLGLLGASLRSFGLWEPWETSWAEIARHMRDHGGWFHPVFDGHSAARPLLPLWLIALGQGVGLKSEWAMRLPMALSVVAGAAVLHLWLRRAFGPWRGLLGALAALACPLVLLGGVTLAGNGPALGALMACVGLFGLLSRQADAEDAAPSLGLHVGLGVALSASTLALHAPGLALPLASLAAVGLAQLLPAAADQTKLKAGVVLGVAVVGWAALTFAPTLGWMSETLADLWLAFAGPLGLTALALVAAWEAPALKPLRGLGGALALGMPAATLAVMGAMFQSQGGGESLEAGPPALRFLAQNLLVTPNALPGHVDFDFWVRQLGFAAYPWTALLPFGVAWALREGRAEREQLAPSLLAAAFVVPAAMMLLLGSAGAHYLFPATSAMGCLAAMALTDRAWWGWLRERPFALRAVGFAAMATILFLSKDLDRYPKDLVGALLTDGAFTAPADFALGTPLKVIRYALLGVVFVGFMDVPSLALDGWRWAKGRRAPVAQPSGEGPAPASPSQEPPAWLATSAKLGRDPFALGAAFAALALAFVALMGLKWVPTLSHHLSQKGLVESYQTRAKPGEKLLTYQLGSSSASFYLSDVEKLGSFAELKAAFQRDERLFFVIPRDQLASLNTDLRKDTTPRQNIHVLDDRSQRFLLASNKLLPGDEELSFVARATSSEKPKPAYQTVLTPPSGERVYAQFDGRIQLIGYEVFHTHEVDRWGEPTAEARDKLRALQRKGEPPVFKVGEDLVIRYYFKVLKRLSTSKQIFLHVDRPGARINGDHYPLGEQFPTQHWLSGDYIVDTQHIKLEAGNPSGVYTLYMGFFQGSNRMKITPDDVPQVRDDRIELGKIELKAF